MKAVRIHEFGGSDKVRLEEMAILDPLPGTARVHVRAAAVNPVDWMIRERIYNPEGADRVPLTLGQDFSGVIDKMGHSAKTDLKEGDEVFGEVWGSFAEYVVVPVEHLVRKPPHLDFVAAASIPMPALTAWQAVIDAARAGPGMRFLIHGASGGVGSFAVQFARLKGASVAATASPPSFDFLRSVGVDPIVDYHRQRFEDVIKSVDVVLDPLGGEVMARSLKVLRPGGLLINLIGEADEEGAKKAGFHAINFGMEYVPRQLAEIARLVEHGTIKPHISQVLPLAEVRKALDLNQQGQSHGKIVLEVPWARA